MSGTLKDAQGNPLYPHTSADNVFYGNSTAAKAMDAMRSDIGLLDDAQIVLGAKLALLPQKLSQEGSST